MTHFLIGRGVPGAFGLTGGHRPHPQRRGGFARRARFPADLVVVSEVIGPETAAG